MTCEGTAKRKKEQLLNLRQCGSIMSSGYSHYQSKSLRLPRRNRQQVLGHRHLSFQLSTSTRTKKAFSCGKAGGRTTYARIASTRSPMKRNARKECLSNF